MQETFIHIGFPKTGTTFIQSQLFAKLKEFQYLTPPFTQQDEQWNRLQYGDDTQFDIEQFKAEFNARRSQDKPLLISDEQLAGKYIYGGMQRTLICKRLKECFPHAKILIIIRGQFDMLKSLHNQYVKGFRKGTKTFGDFIWYRKQENLKYFNTDEDYVHLDYLNYLDIIELYKKNFSEVKILPYELMKHDLDTYIGEIIDFLKVEESLKQISDTRDNLSIPTKKLAEYIVRNSLSNLPINRIELKLLSKRFAQVIHRKNEDEYTSNLEPIKNYYRESNSKLLELYPEVGLQKYRDYY